MWLSIWMDCWIKDYSVNNSTFFLFDETFFFLFTDPSIYWIEIRLFWIIYNLIELFLLFFSFFLRFLLFFLFAKSIFVLRYFSLESLISSYFLYFPLFIATISLTDNVCKINGAKFPLIRNINITGNEKQEKSVSFSFSRFFAISLVQSSIDISVLVLYMFILYFENYFT